MKIRLEVTLEKGEGPRQDKHTVIERLTEVICDIGEVWVQGGDHGDKTSYAIIDVE